MDRLYPSRPRELVNYGARGYAVVTMQTTTPVTWEDVERMPEDGNRYEFIDGRVYVTPAPRLRHHWVSRRLDVQLTALLEDSGRGMVFRAPCLVAFPGAADRVQPDIFFVSRARFHTLTETQVLGAPDLIVEILSPSTAHRDRGVKLDLYRRRGVPEYWIVDPERDLVDVWRFGCEPERERFRAELPVRLGTEPMGVIDLDAVFSRHMEVWRTRSDESGSG